MKNDDSIFAVKLYEMEEQYGKLQCRIRICEQGGSDKIHSELKKQKKNIKKTRCCWKKRHVPAGPLQCRG